MALTLYYGSGSPYAWRVWMALACKGADYEVRMLSFSAGDTRKPEYLAINPRGRVPAIDDDGFVLYESAVIVEYLEERFPSGPTLFPGDLRGRAPVRRLVREADQYAAPAVERLLDAVLFTAEQEQDEAGIATSRTALAEELARWEPAVQGEYLAGPLSAADFTLYPMLALVLRVERKRPDLAPRALIGPRLTAWMDRVEALPLTRETWPPHWK